MTWFWVDINVWLGYCWFPKQARVPSRAAMEKMDSPASSEVNAAPASSSMRTFVVLGVCGDTWFTAVEVIAAIAATAVKVPLKCD